MNYTQFLNRIIDDGINAAKADYNKQSDAEKLEGSVAGFEACRNLQLVGLVDLYTTASEYANKAMGDQHDKYWYFRCYQLEVEWVINVVSAMLHTQGHNPLLSWLPTNRGMMKAIEILGTK